MRHTNEAVKTTDTNQATDKTDETCVVNQAVLADVTIEANAVDEVYKADKAVKTKAN
jgi:hypothetical protein